MNALAQKQDAPIMNDDQLKEAIAAKTAPKITAEYMESRISTVEYIRWKESTLTICVITLDNGYTVRGESACVSPENYDASIGNTYAYKNAFSHLWPLFGFLLAEDLHNNETAAA